MLGGFPPPRKPPSGYLPETCRRTDVFVHPEIGYVQERIKTFRVDLVQLHGHETPVFRRSAKEEILKSGRGLQVIKAFDIAPDQAVSAHRELRSGLRLFFFLTPVAPWSAVAVGHSNRTCCKTATGIRLPSSAEASTRTAWTTFKVSRPAWADVDLNSCFEISPALKDVNSLSRFINKLREQDRTENHHAHHARNRRITYPPHRPTRKRFHLHGIVGGYHRCTKKFDCTKQAYFDRVNQMGLTHSLMVGFGISNRQTLESTLSHATGAIIGSRFGTLLTNTVRQKKPWTVMGRFEKNNDDTGLVPLCRLHRHDILLNKSIPRPGDIINRFAQDLKKSAQTAPPTAQALFHGWQSLLENRIPVKYRQ